MPLRPDPAVPTEHIWRVKPRTPLTRRETEALRLRARGYSCKEVAVELGISVQRVKTLQTNAYTRLEVEGPIPAFVKLGWLRLPE